MSSCCNSASSPTEEELRETVRTHYSNIVQSADGPTQDGGGCCGSGSSCFGPSKDANYAAKLGYSSEDLATVPEGANLGQGCGNPVMFSKMKPGEVVLDLGSGAGFDCFLAARTVGKSGHVIGVDMTPEMVAKARKNATKGGYEHVEFRLGEIEHLPVADGSVDVVISNCVINLVPNKAQVFKEVARVLRSGGRVTISDVVTSVALPEDIRKDLALYAGCLAGATLISDLERFLADANLVDIKITPRDESREFIKNWTPNAKVTDFIVSALIEARKP